MVPALGAVLSSVVVRVVVAVLFATSRPVMTSPGVVVVVAAPQENVLDTYGPPAGVVTVEGVWVHPVEVPVMVADWLEAGPDPASATALVRVNEPTAAPR